MPDPPHTEDESEGLEERVVLGALLPVIPPDETAGVESVRDMDEKEVAQFRSDEELLCTLAPATPYSRAAEAFGALEDVVREVGGETPQRLTRRGQQRVLQALAVFARAMESLPAEFTRALVEWLGEGEAADHLAAARAELEEHPAYRMAIALDAASADQMIAVVHGERVELVLPRESGDIGLVATAADALVFSQRMAARWILEYAEQVHEASGRIARLGGEVVCGQPAVIKLAFRRGEEESGPVKMTPTPVPLQEMQAVQATLRRAERVLEEDPRGPALKGALGMSAERVAAVMAGEAVAGDARGASVERTTHKTPTPLVERSGPPLDMASLVDHVRSGAARMELAWSRALEDEEVGALAAEWESLLAALTAELEREDRDFPEAGRLAQAATVAVMAQALPALQRPTRRATHPSGRALEWFASGAFGALADQLALLARLSSLGPDRPGWSHSLTLAAHAAHRADPEAVVLHVTRAVQARGSDVLGQADPAAAEPLRRAVEGARRLLEGDSLDLADVVLLAEAALVAAMEVLPADPPEPST